MNYTEALKITREASSSSPLNIALGLSGSTHALITYLTAAAELNRRKLECDVPDIGHFHSFLIEKHGDSSLVTMLFPWDLVPALDWRSGIPSTSIQLEVALEKAEKFFNTFSLLSNGRSFYADVVLPPIFGSFSENQLIRQSLVALAAKHELYILSEEIFDLSSYLRSGCPIASDQLWAVAQKLCSSALAANDVKKVLITDCDNVLWAGVIAEDLPDGIQANPEGIGYGHFIYQTYLKQLIQSGILIAAVTKNHPADIKLALSKPEMSISEDDFIAIMASYQTKSSQVIALAKSLNLGLSGFVFIDDNPIEIAEIENNIPEVQTLTYPRHEKDLPKLLSKLNRIFSQNYTTDEDLLRLKSYRTNIKVMPPLGNDPEGSIDGFLKDLNMTLTIKEKTVETLARTVQLLNKTNQFTCNGLRVTEKLLSDSLENNARIFGATLTDDGGNHGEILSLLVDAVGNIQNFAMSCRVFQRYVEYVFFDWLMNTINPITSISYHQTERNEPFQLFLKKLSTEGQFSLSPELERTALPKDTLQSNDFLIKKREFMTIETDIFS